MVETARVGTHWLLNSWNPNRLAIASGWPTRVIKVDHQTGLDPVSISRVRVLYGNVFLIRLTEESAADWRSRLEMVGAALLQSKYKNDITLWASLRRVIGGDLGLCLYVTPFKEHYYAKLRKCIWEIPGCDHDEYGRQDTVPTEKARPVLGASKNQLIRYLTPVWWRGDACATIRIAWAATGDGPEEVDYLIKVPLTEATSGFGSATAQHFLFELVS